MCRAYGLFHSEFLSRSKDDRDKAIHQFIRSKTRCGGCGTFRAEWDPSKGGRLDAYEAHQEMCPGCQKVQSAQEALSKSNAKGVYVSLRPKGVDGG